MKFTSEIFSLRPITNMNVKKPRAPLFSSKAEVGSSRYRDNCNPN